MTLTDNGRTPPETGALFFGDFLEFLLFPYCNLVAVMLQYKRIKQGVRPRKGWAKAMTMTEMRKAYKAHRDFAANTPGLEGLVWYYDSVRNTLEDLWKNGTTTEFDNDFLKVANGYQINTQDYNGLHIMQTLDLHRITASKAVVKELAEQFFG